jgi:hypothetical protein
MVVVARTQTIGGGTMSLERCPPKVRVTRPDYLSPEGFSGGHIRRFMDVHAHGHPVVVDAHEPEPIEHEANEIGIAVDKDEPLAPGVWLVFRAFAPIRDHP